MNHLHPGKSALTAILAIVGAATVWFLLFAPNPAGLASLRVAEGGLIDSRQASNSEPSDATPGLPERHVRVEQGIHLDRIAVEVRSERGDPIPDAVAVLASDGALIHRGTTDQNGNAVLAVAGGQSLVLGVTAQGYVAYRATLSDPLPARTVVVLRSSVTIRGRVQQPDGRPPPAPMLVVAWPTHRQAPSPDDLRLLFAGTPLLPAVETDPAGEFLLDGLSEGRSYLVAAGNTGWTTRAVSEHECRVVPGNRENEPLVLTIWKVFACVARARLEDGGEPPEAKEIGSWSVVVPRSARTVAEIELGLSRIAEAMAGQQVSRPRNWLDLQDDWRFRVLAYTSSEDHLKTLITYWVPGLAPGRAEVHLPHFTGNLPVRNVFLAPKTRDFGTLRVTIRADHDVLASPGTSSAATLFLEPADRRGDEIRIRMASLGSGVHEFRDIPAGRYRARLVAERGSFQQPPTNRPARPITIGLHAATIEFDLRGLAAVQLVFREQRGSEVADVGRIVVTPQSPDGAESYGMCGFRGPPYLLQGLNPGRYRFQVRFQMTAGSDVILVDPVDVQGAITLVSVALRE
jgi:hypothetical protein